MSNCVSWQSLEPFRANEINAPRLVGELRLCGAFRFAAKVIFKWMERSFVTKK